MKRLALLIFALALTVIVVDCAYAVGYPNSGYNASSSSAQHHTINRQTTVDTHPTRIPGDDASAVEQELVPEQDDIAAVPEPAALLLVSIGLIGLAVMRKHA